jgi:hypothetical protein
MEYISTEAAKEHPNSILSDTSQASNANQCPISGFNAQTPPRFEQLFQPGLPDAIQMEWITGDGEEPSEETDRNNIVAVTSFGFAMTITGLASFLSMFPGVEKSRQLEVPGQKGDHDLSQDG